MNRHFIRYLVPLLGLLSLLTSALHAAPISIEGINSLRVAAGLQALTVSRTLTDAAQAHALYLQRYMPPGSEQLASAHEERAGLPEFSGELAPQRALYFGYAHEQVIENVSLGNKTPEESVADLMSAIYHRFAFLDFGIDEIGAAYVGQRYVYDMGKKRLAETCLQQPEAARSVAGYDCLGNIINQSVMDRACLNLPEEALFQPPFAARCENGNLLNQAYMEQVCASPPTEAVLTGAGRYYDLCGNGSRISAQWFKRACASTGSAASYPYSGSNYQICSPAIAVYAEWYQNFCANQPADTAYTQSGRYYKVCANGFEINSEYYESLTYEQQASGPVAVLWPADKVQNIKPVFYSEEPHPTPDLPMTGYPVSVQFNPQKVKSVAIMGFSLEVYKPDGVSDWQPVRETRMIDKTNDVNQRFSEFEFAWFPLRRLDWGGRYRYRIDALVDGTPQQYQAEFSTTKLSLPIYRLQGGVERIQVNSKRFILYREPDAYDNLPFQGVNLRYRSRPYVEANIIDANTVEIRLGGVGCAPVYLTTQLEEQLEINVCKRDKWFNLF